MLTISALVLEREKLLVAAYEVYLAQNISYDCFQYAERNSVAECDCSACLEAQPDFVTRMCTFRRARARVYADAIDRTKVQAKNWMWRAICNPRCRFRLPSTCCDPVGSKLPMQAGCPTCLPTDNCKRISFLIKVDECNINLLIHSISVD